MKKIILLTIGVCCNIFLYSQIGINIVQPEEKLDVNGSLQVRGNIYLGIEDGSEATSHGNSGDFIVSQGPDKVPLWKKMPTAEWSVVQTILTSGDDTGVDFGPFTGSLAQYDKGGADLVSVQNEANGFPIPLLEGDPLAKPWVELSNLKGEFYVEKKNSKILYTAQTVFQLTSMSSHVIAEISIGVFLDGKLQTVRSRQIMGNGFQFSPITISDILTNINPKADGSPHIIQVAVRPRFYKMILTGKDDNRYRHIIVGKSTDILNNTTSFMNQSALTVIIYESLNK